MTDLAHTVQRVTDLLARAGHPTTPEEEARTSAVKAARLIKEHSLKVVPEKSEREPRYRGTPRPNAPPPPPPSKPRAARGRQAEEDEEIVGHRIYARYPGKCRGCKKGFPEGARVIWTPGDGAWHPSCWDDAWEPW